MNWLQPRWEYMHYHPLIRDVDLSSIGIWESHGQIVGVVHPEHAMGVAYFEIDADHDGLKEEMLAYAEESLSVSRDGRRQLCVAINDGDDGFHAVAASRGYVKTERHDPMSCLPIPRPFPVISLPPGFRLKSLAEDNDLRKVDRVLWRGFDHGDEPPPDGIEDRRFTQSAPSYRKELNTVVEAPDKSFVSYCGMWIEPVHSVAYVEPVATDPDYRRMGLASAAVLEGIRRCGAMGASTAWVGSTKPLYLSLGFRRVYGSSLWVRQWT